MSITIGFIVNPIAGMGGKVGLKGTDDVVSEAVHRGATPTAPQKALEMLKKFNTLVHQKNQVTWYTCSGDMGENILKKSGIPSFSVVFTSKEKKTSAADTKNACKKFIEKKVDLILFCGGDGTARDIFQELGTTIPLLGIPAGVKMHSGVFGVNTRAVAKMLIEFINHTLTIGEADILDLDETLYRNGEWNVRLYGIAKGIIEPTYIQVGKTSYESVSEDSVKDELADHIKDEMEKHLDALFLLGPGGTIEYISKKLGIDHTLLGVDAVFQKKLVGKDLNEKQILDLLRTYSKVKIVLSPIGAQGFILGRGNLQLSPKVIQKIGIENIIVISTPAKLIDTPVLRVDTGDTKLDKSFADREFFMVVIGYRLSRVVKIQTNSF
jgi:predicted polyphosphate/ATP-dependent NAD kinase